MQEDLRIRRTKKLLKDALVRKMKQKPFEKISVKDICDEAMVHRTTFYTHFEDKYDLLRYCFSVLETPFDTVELEENTPDGYKKYYMSVATKILGYVNENKDFFKLIIKKNKEESFLERLQLEFQEKIMEKLNYCVENGVKLTAPLEIISSFYSGACLNVVYWWLENEMPFTVNNLLDYIYSLSIPLLSLGNESV